MRRTIAGVLALMLAVAWARAGWLVASETQESDRPPNVIIIFADDMGYGDIASWGHPTIETPHLDRMAQEGQKWTSFYVAAPVCTPSRAGLLTGRLPIRSGMASSTRRVLFPDSAGGLPAGEITIAEALRTRGYATAAIGKWHLGHLPEYLPTSQGFDSYYGVPYSNDMDRTDDSPPGREAFREPRREYWDVPLMRNTDIIERPADQATLTRRYTEEALAFIESHRDQPFFLYLAHTMPHVPLFRSEAFQGQSARGLYGDVIEEIDWSVGQVLDALRRHGLAERTWVVFTSDNGPWLVYDEQGGSAGLLRNGKGTTWEGGMRVPAVMWWPGRVAAASVVRDLGSTLDLFTTALNLAEAKVPDDRVIDGLDLSPAMFGTGPSPRETMFFYRGTSLYAIRKGSFKAHFVTEGRAANEDRQEHDPPGLYNLDVDPSEQWNVAGDHPQVIAEIRRLREAHLANLQPGDPQLERRLDSR